MPKKNTVFISIIILALLIFKLLFTFNAENEVNNIETDLTDFIFDTTYEPNTTNKENENKLNYDSFLDLPYLDMSFVDDKTIQIIKIEYSKMDYYGEFEKGDLTVYNYYKEKYNQLLKGQATFFDKKRNKELYLTDIYIDIYDLENHFYYFFDMDEDGTPELGINSKYIFKYIPNSNEFILWYDLTPHYQLMGSKKTAWIHLGSGTGVAFCELDANGEDEYSTFFYMVGAYEEPVYLVTLPIGNNNDQLKIEKIKNEAYRDEVYYYFRVTGEQYDELSKDMYESLNLAKEKIKEVTFSYTELFGIIDQE